MLAFGFISFQSLQKAWMKIGWKEVKLRYSNKTEPGKKRELSMGFFCSDSIDWTSTLEQNALGFWEVSYPHVNWSCSLLPLALATPGVHNQVHELCKQILLIYLLFTADLITTVVIRLLHALEFVCFPRSFLDPSTCIIALWLFKTLAKAS